MRAGAVVTQLHTKKNSWARSSSTSCGAEALTLFNDPENEAEDEFPEDEAEDEAGVEEE